MCLAAMNSCAECKELISESYIVTSQLIELTQLRNEIREKKVHILAVARSKFFEYLHVFLLGAPHKVLTLRAHKLPAIWRQFLQLVSLLLPPWSMIDVLPTWAPPRKATRYDFSGTEVSSAALRISAAITLADLSENIRKLYGSHFFSISWKLLK